jgi:hypothetical protein
MTNPGRVIESCELMVPDKPTANDSSFDLTLDDDTPAGQYTVRWSDTTKRWELE